MPEGPLSPSPSLSNAPPVAVPHTQAETAKETVISIIIAFALAFIFRGFVVEAFVIPTGSMAPTLMGGHVRVQNPASGYSWPVGPWDLRDNGGPHDYAPVQGERRAITVHDPIAGDLLTKRRIPLHSGDRILVQKYLYLVAEPGRYDVAVFKNPSAGPGHDTGQLDSYIKRLIGLPGEEIALVDGDVFVRDPAAQTGPATNPWEQPGWRIERKPFLQQMAVWQTVFDASFTPLDGFTARRSKTQNPWTSAEPGWDLSGRAYRYTGPAGARTELVFDQTRVRWLDDTLPARAERWTIDDWYPYNETLLQASHDNIRPQTNRFPVSDVRLRAGVEPGAEGLVVEASIRARRREFQAVISGATATIRERALVGEAGVYSAWKDVATGAVPALTPGRVADIEVWHADQAVRVFVDDAEVATYAYDWSPAERVRNATGMTIEGVMAHPVAPGVRPGNPFADHTIYERPRVAWAFAGAPVTLHRVGLDRDIHYQPGVTPRGRPALATSPDRPLRLGPDQFFACGDNSPQSLDGRLWDDVDPWVAVQYDDTVGVVPRELMMGKAFFVYWPSLHYGSWARFVPDFGRMRFIY